MIKILSVDVAKNIGFGRRDMFSDENIYTIRKDIIRFLCDLHYEKVNINNIHSDGEVFTIYAHLQDGMVKLANSNIDRPILVDRFIDILVDSKKYIQSIQISEIKNLANIDIIYKEL